jgi:hypothetical protein
MATAYDPGLDRASCQVHYYVDIDFSLKWFAQHGGFDQNDRAPLEALMGAQRAVMAAGQWPTARYAVQADGSQGFRVFVLPNTGPTPLN